jgi:hypothetical protein
MGRLSGVWRIFFSPSNIIHLSNNMDFPPTVKRLRLIPRQDFWLAICLALLLSAAARPDEAAKAPRFAVRTTDGSLLTGSWRELNSDWSLRLGEGDGTRVASAKVVTVRRVDVPLPPLPMEDHLILANGDRVPYRALRLVEEKFQLRHPNLGEGKDVSVPLAAVAVLWRIAPEKTLDAEKLRRRLTVSARTRDAVCLRNGDRIVGALASLDEGNAVVEVDRRRVTVKMAQVAYIAFNTELAETLRPKGVFARLILTDTRLGHGGRMSLTSASADETTLRGTTVFGAKLRVPLRDIAALDLYQGRAVYLSDLKESKYLFTPFLDAMWPFAVDGNVAEHDLLLGGSTYDKGIGLHSHGRLTYRLEKGYRRFEALVGLDDKDGRGGDARIRVLADGETLLDRALTSREGGVPVDVKVEGVRELTLEVDFGRDGDVRDAVNWADARLIK